MGLGTANQSALFQHSYATLNFVYDIDSWRRKKMKNYFFRQFLFDNVKLPICVNLKIVFC